MSTLVGRFEIERSLDGDGESHRFRAWDRELGAYVLLWLADDATLHARMVAAHDAPILKHEAATMRLLTSAQSSDGLPCAAFEWIDGPLLRDRLRDGPLCVRDTELLAATLAALLDRAHAAGVVHGAVEASNIVLGDGDPERAKLFGFGAHAGDDASDALALARLVVACGDSAARRGSARSRGWDRVAELSAPLATFLRQSLGDSGEVPSPTAAKAALRAWSQELKDPPSVASARAPVQASALLVATWEPAVEPLCEMAQASRICTAVHADGTLTATASAALPLNSQLAALAALALSWQRLRPATRAALCCEIEGDAATSDPFLRAMERLADPQAGIYLDDAAASRLQGELTLTHRGGRQFLSHPLWKRASGSLARRLSIILGVLLSLCVLLASLWWLLAGGS